MYCYQHGADSAVHERPPDNFGGHWDETTFVAIFGILEAKFFIFDHGSHSYRKNGKSMNLGHHQEKPGKRVAFDKK